METGLPAGLSRSEGRKFAFTVGGAFLVLGAVVWWRNHLTVASAFGGLGAVLALLGLIVPDRLGPLSRAWMGLAHLISKVTTPVFMGVVYFLVITPTSLIMRLFGRLPLRSPRGASSYWQVRSPDSRRGDLTRQF